MQIDLPTDQQTLIENLVASGRYSTVQDAISEAIHLLVAQEELREKIQTGIDQANRGELLDHETVFVRLRSIAAADQRAE